MIFFICDKCGQIDSTSFQTNWYKTKLCTECLTGKWHNLFSKEIATFDVIEKHGRDNFIEYRMY